MDILGVGPLELIVILVVMMLVFGPDRLPEMGAKLGKGLRGMRRATREFSREIEAARSAIEAPLDNIKEPLKEISAPFEQASDAAKKVAGAVQTAKHPGRAIQQSIKREFTEATEDIDLKDAVGNDSKQTAAKKTGQDAASTDAGNVPKPDPLTKKAVMAAQATRKRGRAIEEALKRELAEQPSASEEQPAGEVAAEIGGAQVADESAPEAAAAVEATEPAPRISPFDDAISDEPLAESPEAGAPAPNQPEQPAEEA